jgi:hypothetical protein
VTGVAGAGLVVAAVALPGGGVAAPGGELGYLPAAGGGIEAVELAGGEVRWHRRDADLPLLALEDRVADGALLIAWRSWDEPGAMPPEAPAVHEHRGLARVNLRDGGVEMVPPSEPRKGARHLWGDGRPNGRLGSAEVQDDGLCGGKSGSESRFCG